MTTLHFKSFIVDSGVIVTYRVPVPSVLEPGWACFAMSSFSEPSSMLPQRYLELLQAPFDHLRSKDDKYMVKLFLGTVGHWFDKRRSQGQSPINKPALLAMHHHHLLSTMPLECLTMPSIIPVFAHMYEIPKTYTAGDLLIITSLNKR